MKPNFVPAQGKVILFLVFLLFRLATTAQVVTLFSEDFSSGNFTANNWTFPNGQGNWQVGSSNTPQGGSAPNAFFNWAVATTNYSYALVSNTINATGMNGQVTLDYLLLFNPYSSPTTLEQFNVEYKSSSSSGWNLLASYSNTPTSIQNWSVSGLAIPGMAGQIFQIRFTAFGANSFSITRWSLDDIVVKGTNCPVSLPALSITAASTICAGASVTLTATGGGSSYTWSPSGGNASVTIVSPATSTSYALISSLPGCTAAPVSTITTISVLTNTVPLSLSASSFSGCAGNSFTLNASGAPSYSWSNGTTGNSLVVSPGHTATYSVSNTNALGCTIFKAVTLTVSALPPVTAYATSTLTCKGDANNLIASGADTYLWDSGSTHAVITVSPQSGTIYTVTGTNLSGCSSSATISVFVPAPITLSGTSTLCAGNSTTLQASGALTYTWNTGHNASSLMLAPNTSSVYSVSGTDSYGCITSASLSLVTESNPTVQVMASSSVICAGETLTISAAGASTYSWNTTSTLTVISQAPTISTVYTVSGTSSAGCSGSSSSATILITVIPIPSLTIHGAGLPVCAGSSVQLTASGAAGYNWSTGDTSPSLTISPGTSSVYTLTGTTLQCSSTTTVLVPVIPMPTISIAGNSILCKGQTAALLASGAQSYSWNTGAASNIIYVSPAVSSVYTVTGTNGSNCSDTKTVGLRVEDYPVITLNTSSDLVCEGEPVILTAGGATAYLWSNHATAPSIILYPLLTTTYTVEGNNAGCRSSAVITVSVQTCAGIITQRKDKEMPLVFPNPGSDRFYVRLNEHEVSASLEVLNSLGKVVLIQPLNSGTNEVNFSVQDKGVYFFRVINGGTFHFQRVVKD